MSKKVREMEEMEFEGLESAAVPTEVAPEVADKISEGSVSFGQMKELMQTLVQEMKKPSQVEQKKLDEEAQRVKDELEMRKNTSVAVRQMKSNEESAKQTCLHEGGRPVHPHTVSVRDEFGGYILCQKCRAVVRPDAARAFYPKDYRGNIIFSTALYNKLYQTTGDVGIYA